MITGETGGGLISDPSQRGWFERKIRGHPGVFGQRQHVTERGPLGDAAGDEIGRP